MHKKQNTNSKEALENLFDAFSEGANANKDDLKKSLEEEGIDSTQVLSDGMAFVKKLQGRVKIELSKNETLSRVALIKEKIIAIVSDLSQDNKAALARILFGEKASLAVNFNKLSELDDNDVAGMIDDIKLLEFLESFEKEE